MWQQPAVNEQEGLEHLMRKFFPRRLHRKGCWSYHARTTFEGVDLYVYDREQDIYHRAHVSGEELVAHNHAFDPTIGAALRGLVEAINAQEEYYAKGY